MPAVLSSLIQAVADQPPNAGLCPAGLVGQSLLAMLDELPDPRSRSGRRHRLGVVLALSVCAVLAGARSLVGIAEWAADLPRSVREQLGLGRWTPCETTIRRTLQRLDADALDVAFAIWLRAHPAAQPAPPDAPPDGDPPLPTIAVDGKTVRGARHGEAGRSTCSPRSTPSADRCWGRPASRERPTK